MYWLIIFIVALISYIIELKNLNLNFSDVNNIKDLIIGILFSFMFFLLLALLKCIYITIAYVGTIIAFKKHFKHQLDTNDFKNNDYYRNIINNYSICTLSYMDKFSIDDNAIISSILSLKLKNKLNDNL